VVARPPAQAKETFYARLLEANLFCTETGGATLAQDRMRDEILLCRRLDLTNTDFAFFRQCLESLVDACERLRIDLSDDEHPGPDIPHAGGPTAANLLQRAEREQRETSR
jgi:Tir chaperone protein (CesT) family